ncbi:Uncharacterised protein [Mycobacteroides abscessus subsp. abscessus]|nr:Uncharacterised protein [Mycobacteroides abscessus subsp. abscessus]
MTCAPQLRHSACVLEAIWFACICGDVMTAMETSKRTVGLAALAPAQAMVRPPTGMAPPSR